MIQNVVAELDDGIIGPETLESIEICETKALLQIFGVLQISHDVSICKLDKSQRKFFFGWCRRTLRDTT